MKLSARLMELDTYYIQEEVGDLYVKNAVLEEKDFRLSCKGVDYITYNKITSSGMILIDVQMVLFQSLTDLFEIDGDCVMMEFMFNSNVEADINDLEWIKNSQANTHNVTFAKNYSGRFKMAPNTNVNFFIIILSKDYYFKLIPEDLMLHKEFANNIYNGKTCTLSSRILQFNPSIHAIIHEIRYCKRKGELRRLYIENKIQELLLLQLEMHQEQFMIRERIGLNEQELIKLMDAKTILDNNFRTAPALSELARMTYLNEFKLKKGFKACFGMTIKGYVIALKMRCAMALLKEEKHLIGEIAYLCGYNGLVQFSTAFKAFYGYSPKSVQCGTCQHNLLDFRSCCPTCDRMIYE